MKAIDSVARYSRLLWLNKLEKKMMSCFCSESINDIDVPPHAGHNVHPYAYGSPHTENFLVL